MPNKELKNQIEDLTSRITNVEEDKIEIELGITDLEETVSKHRHNSIDKTKKLKIEVVLTESLQGTSAATAGNYGVIFINKSDKRYIVREVREVHGTAGDDGSAVTLQIERLQATEAKGAGDDLLSSGIDLKGTADTVTTGSLITVKETLTLEVGDRLGLVTTGTLTTLDSLNVTVYIEEV